MPRVPRRQKWYEGKLERALRIERLRTEVAWDDHELVAFFRRKGFAPVPRLVLEADLAALSEAQRR